MLFRRLSRLSLIPVLVLYCTSLSVAQTTKPTQPAKFALLIGIDKYKSSDIPQLRGSVNDIRLMRELLIGKFGMAPENIKMLENEQATHKAIIDAFKNHLIAKANTGDVVVVHFSGHGSQMPDNSNDEVDQLDETLVPYDSRTDGVFDISDDEINGLLKQLSQKTKHITLIFDSCHSGAAARGGNAVRQIAADTRVPPPLPSYAVSIRGGEGDAGLRPNNSDYVLISGSLAKELSNETEFEGRRQGVLTWFLASALKTAPDRATYRDVMDRVKAEVTTRFPSQHPQIEGPGQDLVVFGTEKIQVKPYALVEPSKPGKVRIEAGSVFGMGTGSTLKVFPPRTSDFEATNPVATVKVTNVSAFESEADIIGGGTIQPGSRGLLEATSFGDVSIPVFVDSSTSASLAKVKDALKEMQAITLVQDAMSARLVVSQREGKLWVQSGDLQPLAAPVSASDANARQVVTDRVKDLIHWMVLLDLKNPNSKLNIAVSLRRVSDPLDAPAPKEIMSCSPESMTKFHTTGEKPPAWCLLTYQIHNNSSRPLFIYVLDVSSNGTVCSLFPPEGEQQELGAGQSFDAPAPIAMTTPDGYSLVHDTIKVIATASQIKSAVFPRGCEPVGVRSGPKGGLDPLSMFLAHATRGMRAGTPIVFNPDNWNTVQRVISIRRAGVTLSSFAIHNASEKEAHAIEDKLGQNRSLCLDNGTEASGDCERLVPLTKDGTILELLPRSSTRGGDGTVSVGQAFDEAYRLQDQTGARRVEPQFEIQVPGLETEQGIDKRDISGDNTHDPAAAADDQWNLKQVQVVEAWKKIRDRFGLQEGAEAEGILIAHPDTGYWHHPETWVEARGKRPIDAMNGRNYYEGGNNAIDPLLSDRWLDNPGHGTASGSVIVSPFGCQLPNAAGCVSGIARGAQLIPLRVHRTVSQFNTSYLSRAIYDVAEGKIAGQPRLISIAMGGPPTLSMWKAVKAAEKNGVLIVAAAGNYVRTVVWPARFHSAVAVAAGNVRCEPWKHSSNGSAVDIMAPGESVWRATLNEQHEPINGMGKGTTFATSHVAGSAALWLSVHRHEPAFRTIAEQGLLTETFRTALQASAWRPAKGANPPGTQCNPTEWDSHYGAGILNIAGLLDVSLSGSQSRGILASEEETVPLFASLYPKGTDLERIRADYRALFASSRSEQVGELSHFETEILYHYTVDEEVQREVNALVSGQSRGEPAAAARRALLREDLSGRLRQTLGQ